MTAPVGAVLAGGAGRRLGGAKPSAILAGRSLLSYPVASLSAVLDDVVVLAKRDTDLPDVPTGVDVWIEPDEPRHPLAGVVEALRRADGRAVVVLACDLPMVDAGLVRRLVAADARRGAAVVATAGGRIQPLCARYDPAALEHLRGFDPAGRTIDQVAALDPVLLDVPPAALRNVNDPDELEALEAELQAGA